MSDIAPATLAALDAGIARMRPLPVIDRTLVRVRELCDEPDSSTAELVATLQSDANLAANLLRCANSAWAARPVRAASIHQAVTLMGRRAIGAMALEAVVCSYFERAPGAGGVARGQLHIHAAHVGALSAELARRVGVDPGEAHLAGLLHDIGKLVLPAAFGDAAADAIAATAPGGPQRAEAERAELGVDHAQAGGRFLMQAGLPAALVAAIVGHHGQPGATTALTRCVQVANAAVAVLAGQPVDGALLDAAMAELGQDMMILEDAAAAAVPALVVHQDAASATLTAELERLTFEARSDDLTGLLNRRYWSSEAKAVLGRGAATVLLIDVDRFKQVNDRYGHHVGDFVLAEIAAVLRTRGVAGRLGGDEFAVVIEHADPTGAVAGVLIAEIAERFAGHDLAVSVCVGVAATARPGVDLRAALRAADAAAYAAKRSGRATFRVATWEGHQPAEAGAEAGDGARRAAAA